MFLILSLYVILPFEYSRFYERRIDQIDFRPFNFLALDKMQI